MAYRRSLCTRANLIARQSHPSCHPSISIFGHTNDRKNEHLDGDSISHEKINSFLQSRSFGTSFNKSSRSNFFIHDRKYPNTFLSSSAGSFFCRYMSSTIGEGSEKIEFMSDVAEVLTDTTVQSAVSQASVADEVAIAAADSFLSVKGVQYFIDGIHSFTGLNWWACIVLTTLLIRGATVPLLINQLKSTAKLTLLRPHLEEVKTEMQEKGMDPRAVAEGQQKMKKLFNEFGVSPFTPLKGLFIQGPVFISFFLGVSNMAEKMPSFKNGGAYWFVDLTTPDTMYIFPVLTALTFWITVEYNMQEGMEGNPIAATMKNVMRGLAIATVPLTMNFPKAIFCYWVTSNVFSLVYGIVLKVPGVKKALGVPEIPVANTNTTPQPAFSFLTAMKQATAAPEPTATTLTAELSPSQDRKISSSSVISQRLRSLEKEVKGRKKMKNKKK
ncbi:mitochondrial inner membrane protein OXA1-like isoform X1 [Cucurbita pepo subsp. pepo]|uniref:mitochondrial inner membrane protein OXA1-like isoform X1 n=1 Tax=Cucurbita pepo subsp. pepo TaxID=3664 RepID=UPI000C9D784D|nr:mitochondrial inner membrane protein OXA1-like isoform X1 [Cucurbita pepo subsp. pepo]XP_023552637.1 mitochondrial inner membrane protein OXA1-like isoform X1 [Cucurbita pepo subsp. pepo]XP_023552638.1 mitochondrial inner membrane protein OXA1-like isoform X1 [Cucurbita pepo subsp. pepo]XP_023552639.1 mitochondrial inner membrane protein OXA1-like isoform X1 [Cucurbita pepo subsp. pepo]